MAPLSPVRVTLAATPGGEDPAALEVGPGPAVLERLDDRHAVLRQPERPPVPVLILPGVSTIRPSGSAGRTADRTGSGAAAITYLEVVVDGWRFELAVEDAGRARLRERATRGRAAGGAARPAEVRAIIPGRIAAVAVVAGQQVAHGDPLLVIEAMKMQNELRATRAGTASRVAVQAGQTVEAGDLLVVIE